MGPNNESVMTGIHQLWCHAWPITYQTGQSALEQKMQWLVVGPGSMAVGNGNSDDCAAEAESVG